MTYCPQCRAQLDDDAVYCSKCGAKISSNQPDAAWIAGMQEEIKDANSNSSAGIGAFIISLIGICASYVFYIISEWTLFLVLSPIFAFLVIVAIGLSIYYSKKAEKLREQLKSGRR